MQRGDVFWADLIPRSGSEQRGRRPVIIVSHNGFNQTPGWRSIIVVPISTSAAQARRGPTAIALPQGAGGLDRAKLTQHVGALSPELLNQIDVGLKAALDLS